MNKTIENIVAAIRNHSTFIITSHENPDGDAVGSSLALASFLRKIGKDATVYLRDPLPEVYSFLPGAETVINRIPEAAFDVAFVLDVGEYRRTGEAFCNFDKKGMLIYLDHHLDCAEFATYNLIDPKAAATGVMVYRVINQYGYSFDLETALCLYVSIITDTGSYRYSNSNKEAFVISGEMIDCGINAWDVAEKLYESQPLSRLKLLAKCLPTLEMTSNGQVASITITLDMYADTAGDAELTDGFINYPRSVSGVEVSIFFRQLSEQQFKVGFRSKGKISVAEFASKLGGGGHHNAAGCTVDGTIEQVKSKVYSIVAAAL